jgi:hypothetical protein
MAKVTMKEKVLQFVEKKGSASFTEIQEFIVDEKFGKGTYRDGYENGRNTNRGYYCGAFSVGYYSKTLKQWQPGGYFLRGNDRLFKISNQINPNYGKYVVVRNGELKMSI